jgi:hypothetical protein
MFASYNFIQIKRMLGFWKHKIREVSMGRWVLFVTATLLLGFLAIALSRYQIDILITPISEPSIEPTSGAESDLPPPPDAQSAVVVPTPGSPFWNPNASSAGIAQSGFLRVSNQTQHPIRVVILDQTQAGTSPSKQPSPAHWDFAPAEGQVQGLMLSLPSGNVTLHPGDIIMAYAQDGASLDWGPYIIGQTQQPVWNSRVKEWQFILRAP